MEQLEKGTCAHCIKPWKNLVIAGVSQHETPQLYLVNPASVQGDLLRASGFDLIQPANDRGVGILGPEELVRLAPDIIIILDPSSASESTQHLYTKALSPLQVTKPQIRTIYLSDAKLSSMGPGCFTLGQEAASTLKAMQGASP